MALIADKLVTFKHINLCDYQQVHHAMLEFTDARSKETLDQVWFVEHNPVFTLGRNGNTSNLLQQSNIPLINSDRGGDITYHGPGQLIIYTLMDLQRLNLGIKSLVNQLEAMVITYLANIGITGHRIQDAPGVYVDNQKIASLGLRVRKGCSFHGLAINIDMDLTPFSYINPCGLTNMQVVQVKQYDIHASLDKVACDFQQLIVKQFYS